MAFLARALQNWQHVLCERWFVAVGQDDTWQPAPQHKNCRQYDQNFVSCSHTILRCSLSTFLDVVTGLERGPVRVSRHALGIVLQS